MKTNAKLIKIIESIIFENASDHVKKLFDSWAKNKSGNYDKAMGLMDDFFEYASMLPKNDFAQYSSADEMESAILNAKKVKAEKSEKKSASSDIDKIYEDDNVLVIKAKTHEASCKYGAGTTWCTAAKKTDEDWLRHNQTGVEFIWINKKLPSDDNNHKLSLFLRYNEDVDWCNRINRCDSTAPYEKNDLGVENWEEIFELCDEYFENKKEQKIAEHNDEWDKIKYEIFDMLDDDSYVETYAEALTYEGTIDDIMEYITKFMCDYLSVNYFKKFDYYFNYTKHQEEFYYILNDMINSNLNTCKAFFKQVVDFFFQRQDPVNYFGYDAESLFELIDEEIIRENGATEIFFEVFQDLIIEYFLPYYKEIIKNDFK